MTLIEFDCDRCGKRVTGLHIHSEDGGGSYTSGFYVVSGGAWATYGRDDEHFVCDECVQAMPEWQALYGPQPTQNAEGSSSS